MRKPMLWLSIAATDNGSGGSFVDALPTEVGAVLTNADMQPVDASYDRIRLTKRHAAALQRRPETIKILKSDKSVHPEHPEAVSVTEAEANIIEMIDEAGIGDVLVPIAGRGADVFLLPVVREHMPRLATRLEWWTFDASQLTRWARAAGALDRFRQHEPDLSEFEDVLASFPDYSAKTLREVLTAAFQFRAVVKEK
jgi:hypothetical protein